MQRSRYQRCVQQGFEVQLCKIRQETADETARSHFHPDNTPRDPVHRALIRLEKYPTRSQMVSRLSERLEGRELSNRGSILHAPLMQVLGSPCLEGRRNRKIQVALPRPIEHSL